MAGGDATNLDNSKTHAKGTGTQTESATGRATPTDANIKASAACEASNRPDDMSDTSKMHSHQERDRETELCQIDVSSRVKEAPERPRAPKWAVVERLEALAEDLDSQKPPTASTTTAHMNDQPAGTMWNGASHAPYTADLISTRPFNHLQRSLIDTSRYAPRHASTPIQTNVAPAEASTSYHLTYPKSVPIKVTMPNIVSPSQCVPTTNHSDLTMSEVAYEPRPRNMTVQVNVCGSQQIMQDYIAEIEREAWDAPEEDEFNRTSSLMEARIMQSSPLLNRKDENDYERAYPRSTVSSTSPPLGRAEVIHLDRVEIADWEQEDEQRFMSSFWRPNGYPI